MDEFLRVVFLMLLAGALAGVALFVFGGAVSYKHSREQEQRDDGEEPTDVMRPLIVDETGWPDRGHVSDVSPSVAAPVLLKRVYRAAGHPSRRPPREVEPTEEIQL